MRFVNFITLLLMIPLLSNAKEIRIGVIDTGVNYNNPLFNGLIEDKSENDFLNNSSIKDEDGHGTHVTGIIAKAIGKQKIYVYRNHSKKYMEMIKSTPVSVETRSLFLPQVIDKAIADKIDILNISIVVYKNYKEMEDAFKRAESAGMLIVVAAGNDHFNLNVLKNDIEGKSINAFPCAYELSNIICVGNYEKKKGKRKVVSNYGTLVVDVWANGNWIKSACLNNKQNCFMSGSSMSSPRIAGAAYHELKKNPTLAPSEIKGLVIKRLKSDPHLLESGKTGHYLD